MTRPPLKERMKALFDEYGKIAFLTYMGIFVLVLGAFAVAISFGVKVDSASGTAGTLAAAWLATKVTQPVRIVGTLVLTPMIGKLVQRARRQPPTLPPDVTG